MILFLPVIVENKLLPPPLLAPAPFFSENAIVNDSKLWKASKWPFLLADAALLAVAWILIQRASHPIDQSQIIAASACVALGSILGCLPFILDYRVSVKSIDAAALGSITEKLQNLEKLAAQISAATNEWMNAQSQAEKTSTLAKEIADGMAGEVQRFSAFMQKMNESEKAALRLEVDKLRRGEAEWLQILVRILDHVFLLHTAAVRSGQPKVIDQITHFQNACRDAVRRIGLTPFSAEPGEPFDPPKHQDVDGKAQAVDGGVVSETAACGFTFQGKLLRPALVRVKAPDAEPEPLLEPAEEKSEELPLQEPD
jgi:molecular chaperone GrpE (heat shock protein)